MNYRFLVTSFICILTFFLTSFSLAAIKKNYTTPTVEVMAADWPELTDDLDFKNLDIAIDRQLLRFKQKRLDQSYIYFGTQKFLATRVVDTLITFKALTNKFEECLKTQNKQSCQLEFNNTMKNKFRFFKPELSSEDRGYGQKKFTRFTAYYTPLLDVSLMSDPTYKYPIYNLPSPQDRNFSRVQIDFENALSNKGYELFYSRDLFDNYLLHVQGGGKVRYLKENKTEEKYISYSGTNEQEFNFISLYMRDQGYIPNLGIETQRNFLENNISKQKEIYSYCPSYVFFKITSSPPEGSDSVPLTDGRSIATDKTYYSFKGTLAYVMASKPKSIEENKMQEFSRFFIDQDTGGAIKGKARVDIYHGEGKYAEKAAYNTDVMGQLYFLILK